MRSSWGFWCQAKAGRVGDGVLIWLVKSRPEETASLCSSLQCFPKGVDMMAALDLYFQVHKHSRVL